MGKYQNLNVMNVRSKASDYMSDDAIQDVANMINTKGVNRAQRRRLEKSLGKVETIRAHMQNHYDQTAFNQYKKAVDANMVHFFSILALTMQQDYHWKEDETHDQISSLLERVGNKIDKYANMGYDNNDLTELVSNDIGIELISKV